MSFSFSSHLSELSCHFSGVFLFEMLLVGLLRTERPHYPLPAEGVPVENFRGVDAQSISQPSTSQERVSLKRKRQRNGVSNLGNSKKSKNSKQEQQKPPQEDGESSADELGL